MGNRGQCFTDPPPPPPCVHPASFRAATFHIQSHSWQDRFTRSKLLQSFMLEIWAAISYDFLFEVWVVIQQTNKVLTLCRLILLFLYLALSGCVSVNKTLAGCTKIEYDLKNPNFFFDWNKPLITRSFIYTLISKNLCILQPKVIPEGVIFC